MKNGGDTSQADETTKTIINAQKPGILSDVQFSSRSVSAGVMRGVEAMGHEFLTHVQQAAIPPLLQGKDVLGAARTGARPL